MLIEIIEINPLGGGKFNIAFNGTNARGTFGLVAEYEPKTKRIKFPAVSPRQPKKPFKAYALVALAKEDPVVWKK